MGWRCERWEGRHGMDPGLWRGYNWQDYLESSLGQAKSQKYVGRDVQQLLEYNNLSLRREACPKDMYCGNKIYPVRKRNLLSEGDHPGSRNKMRSILDRNQWDTMMQATGKGKPGRQPLRTQQERLCQERRVNKGTNCSLRCQSKKSRMAGFLLGWAGKWSLENLLRLVSIMWQKEKARWWWIKKETMSICHLWGNFKSERKECGI